MKRLLLIAALMCLAPESHVSTQSAIIQAFEYPVAPPDEGYAEISSGMFFVAGYALDCRTGDHPEALMITAQRLSIGWPQHYVATTIVLSPHLLRPDVPVRYGVACPAVSSTTGYAAHISPPLPPGYWRVEVTWAGTFSGQDTASKIVRILP